MKNALEGNREKALARDGFKCIKCGLSAEESLKKYSRSLYISHLGNKDDHSLNNLKTMCIACHNATYSRSKRSI